MKIVCDSCGAKYSIADEKVAGKVFKIRCKKCSAVIVVRGDEMPPQADAAPADAPAESPEAIWYVVIDGDQQGPYAPAQIGDLLSQGTIDWESYIWRDGFEGWVAVREATELVDALGGPKGGAAVPGVHPPEEPEPSPFGADPFAASAASARHVTGGDPSPAGGVDLFAQSSSGPSPFRASEVSAAEAGPLADPATPFGKPAAGGTAATAMTGRRSENSVLFSLSNLQALATGGPTGSPGSPLQASPGGRSGAAASASSTAEGSGLIDIRALASTNGASGPAVAAKSEGASIDDLLSIGTGSPLASSLTAPILGAPAEEKAGGRGLLIAVVILAVLFAGAAAAAVVIAFTRPTPAPIAAAVPAITPGVDPGQAGTLAGAAGTDQEASAPDTAEVPEPGPRPSETKAAGGRPAEEDRPNPRTEQAREERQRQQRERVESASTAAAPTPTMVAAAAPSMSLDIEDLLSMATGMSATTAPAPAANADLPETPSRAEVGSALRSVSGGVRACGNGAHGQATAAVTVAGATGRVQNVQVQGQFAGTPVAACIANAVKQARFSRFRRETFTVSFPYVL